MWKTCTRVRWVQLDSLIVIVNFDYSWCLHDSRVLCCQVVNLARFEWARVSSTLSDMSDSYLLQSFHSNSTSLCCYENFMDDVDYFVVMA
jgi:hypothetical protein